MPQPVLSPQPHPVPFLQLLPLLPLVLHLAPRLHLNRHRHLSLPLNPLRRPSLLLLSPIMALLACIPFHGRLAERGLPLEDLAQMWESGLPLLVALSSPVMELLLKFIVSPGRPMVPTSLLVIPEPYRSIRMTRSDVGTIGRPGDTINFSRSSITGEESASRRGRPDSHI